MQADYSGTYCEPVSVVLAPSELEALRLMRATMGFDPVRTFQFWEAIVARLTLGTRTDHTCPWDVEIRHGKRVIRIEVKHSKEFECRFRTGPRRIFKFAQPKGPKRSEKAADVIVLIGIDLLEMVSVWVVPRKAIRHCMSVTMNPPAYQRRPSKSGIDKYACPLTQVLPEILRAARYSLPFDEIENQANAYQTRRKHKALGDLFDGQH